MAVLLSSISSQDKNKKLINIPEIISIIVIERINAFPMRSRKSIHTFAKHIGILLGIINTLNYKYTEILPKQWQKHYNFKKNNRCKNNHDGMMDATLLGYYYVQTHIKAL